MELTMTKYFFHIRDHGVLISDDEGMELSGIGAARAEAISSVNDLVLANLQRGRASSGMVEIADVRGKMLDAIPLRCPLN